MKTSFKASFLKDLGGISDRKLQARIADVIAEVEATPTLSQVRNMKHLSGAGAAYRIRVGEFRLGVLVEGDLVIFVRCLDRKNLYRYFP